jgi:putative transposase
MFLHKNSQKRIYLDDAVYFITLVIHGRHPFFAKKIFCDLFVEELRICKKMKPFDLYGFVIMPDHVHLLIRPGEKFNYSDIMHNFKRTSSLHINWLLKTHCEGADIYPRLRIPEKIYYLKRYYKINSKLFPKFRWQKSFHDHYIRNDRDFNNHLWYIWKNPEKHGLTKNFDKYPFSSYNNYIDLIDNAL